MYREPGKGLKILLSRTLAGSGRKVEKEQEVEKEHVLAFSGASVQDDSFSRDPSTLNSSKKIDFDVCVFALMSVEK